MVIRKSYMAMLVLSLLVILGWITKDYKLKNEDSGGVNAKDITTTYGAKQVKPETEVIRNEVEETKKQKHPRELKNEQLYRAYTVKVRELLVEITKPLSEEDKKEYLQQVEEANSFAFSDYNVYPMETLISLSQAGDSFASRALINRVSSEEAEIYALRALDSGQLVSSAIALRLILSPETRSKAYAYLLLGVKRGDFIARKSILVHLQNIPTTEEEIIIAMEYLEKIEKQLSKE